MSIFDENKIDSDISLLKSIDKIPELKKELEELLKSNTFSMKDIKESKESESVQFGHIVNHIESCVIRLAKKFEVKVSALKVFLSLDKSVIGKIPFAHRGAFNNTIHIQLASSKFVLHGGSISNAYSKMHKEVIDFLNQNIELLPEASKKFIKAKNKIIDSKPDLDITSLKNDFSVKAFINALPKDMDVNFLTGLYEQLENRRNLSTVDEVANAVLFHKAICLKYNASKNKGFAALKKRIALGVYRAFDTIFYTWSYSKHVENDPIYNLIDRIIENDDMLDFFYFKVKNRNAPISVLFANFAKTEQQKKLAEEIWALTLKKDLREARLPFEECSSELQNMLLKELKESDMGISFKVIKKNLKAQYE